MAADQRLQQLRRVWDEGDLETQVRLLRERMRAGELSEERVRLAAGLGNPVSCELLTVPLSEPGNMDHVCGRLEEYGESAITRSTLATTRVVLSRMDPNSPALGPLLEGVAVCERMEVQQVDRPFGWATLYVEAKRLILEEDPRGAENVSLGYAALQVFNTLSLPGPDWQGGMRWALSRQEIALGGLGSALEVIRNELVPWALGLRDPVADRVAAREAAGE